MRKILARPLQETCQGVRFLVNVQTYSLPLYKKLNYFAVFQDITYLLGTYDLKVTVICYFCRILKLQL